MTTTSTYPASLDTFVVAIDGAKTLADATQKHSEVHDWEGDALNKIEIELGVNPKGAAATVAAAIAAKVPTSYLDTDGTLAANSNTKVATQAATKTYADTKVPTSYLDADTTLAADSDVKVATQKATKAYADARIASVPGRIAAATRTSDLTITSTSGAAPTNVLALPAASYNGSLVSIRITAMELYLSSATTNNAVYLELWDDGASTALGKIARLIASAKSPAMVSVPLNAVYEFTPAAGTHTYSVRGWTTEAGDSTIVAGGAGGANTTVPIKITATYV